MTEKLKEEVFNAIRDGLVEAGLIAKGPASSLLTVIGESIRGFEEADEDAPNDNGFIDLFCDIEDDDYQEYQYTIREHALDKAIDVSKAVGERNASNIINNAKLFETYMLGTKTT